VSTEAFPREPESAGRARAYTRAVLAAHGISPGSELSADVQLCVSEAVANAVTHGQGQPVLTVSCTSDMITVTVHDDLPAMIPARHSDQHGRGLAVIAALAESFDVIPGSRGKDLVLGIPVPVAHLAAA
jgi:anti-sigma regulatory factor (Ser/Thr protein kinase)